MGREPVTAQSEKSTERTTRLRDNKRRHRARQKEYVLDLERRLVETREQGIQATKEVQIAAQRVVRQNAGLRDLLQRIGYTENAINGWLKENGFLNCGELHQPRLESMLGQNEAKVASSCGPRAKGIVEAQNVCEKERNQEPEKTFENAECLAKQSLHSVASEKEKSNVALATTCSKPTSPPKSPEDTTPPCKLLTLLAKNPTADITQVALPPQPSKQPCKINTPEDHSTDGVECATAYKMLMQYATSDEKMDRIALALENGCTKSANGGCKVKKSVVWEVLDEECA